jgi:hypothetical protein
MNLNPEDDKEKALVKILSFSFKYQNKWITEGA